VTHPQISRIYADQTWTTYGKKDRIAARAEAAAGSGYQALCSKELHIKPRVIAMCLILKAHLLPGRRMVSGTPVDLMSTYAP